MCQWNLLVKVSHIYLFEKRIQKWFWWNLYNCFHWNSWTRLKFDSMNFFQLNVVLEISKWSSFYSNVMFNVEEFFQHCLFSFSHNCRIDWCFLDNLKRCAGKTSCNSFLVFCSLIARICPSVVPWLDNEGILNLVLPFINIKILLGIISFNFSSWPVQTLHIIFFFPPTSITFSQLNRSFHFLKVVSFRILLFDIFVSYHLFFP